MRLTLMLILATALTAACKPAEQSAAEATPAETPAPDVADTGKLAIEFSETTSPSGSLGVVQTTLQSVPQTDLGQALAGTLAVSTSLVGSGYEDEQCDGNGYPIAKDGEATQGGSNQLSVAAADWPARHFFCLLKTGTSPETMIGSIVINKGVMCALERAGALEESKLGADQAIEVTVDTNCFSREFVESMNNEGGDGQSLTEDVLSAGTMPMTVRHNKLTGDAHWDSEILLTMDGETDVYRFRSTKEMLSGMRLSGVGAGEDSGYTYSISSSGTVRFENRLLGGDPSDPAAEGFTGSKHIRILVEGVLNKETFTFDSVTKVEGASADYHGDATLASVKGNVTDGLFLHGQYCQGSSCAQYENYTLAINDCTPAGKCAGNTGIPFTAADFPFALTGSEAEVTDMGEFLSSATLPLSYTSVTLSDLP